MDKGGFGLKATLVLRPGLFVSTLLSLAACGDFQREASPPNIVIILADDLGIGDLGCYNPASKVPTPHMDRLAREGIRFTDAHSPSAVCTPTRYGLLTGRYCWRSSLKRGVLNGYGRPLIEANRPTFASFLKSHGYHTGIVGKWHLGHGGPATHPNSRGFEHFMGFLTGSVDHLAHVSRDGGYDWQRNRASIRQAGHSSALIAREAIGWVEGLDPDQPFFLVVSFHAPHRPLQATAETIQTWGTIEDPERRTFLAMVQELDTATGKIIRALEEAGAWEKTLALYLSDNGAAREWGGDNGNLRGGKASTFEGGLRVPAVVRWPGIVSPGSNFSGPVSLMDLAATLLAAGGAAPDPEADGGDLRSHWEEGAPLPDRPLVFTACSPAALNYAFIQWPWKLVRRSLRKGGNTRQLLFHLERDPGEERNQASSRPDLVEDLSRDLDAWLERKGAVPECADEQPPPGWAPPVDWAQPPAMD